MKGIILHGGAGTRLRPLTFTGPKQLVPVANKPISQYVLEDLVSAGVKDIAIVLGETYPELVKEHYGDGSRFGAKITYIHQGKPLGIAHAVALCREFIGEDRFIVYLGDNLLQHGVKPYLDKFLSEELDAMVLLKEVKDPTSFGVAKFDERGELIGLVEKPKKPPSNYALVGVYFLTPVFFEVVRDLKPSWRGELEITDALQMMIDRKLKVSYGIVSGWWIDTGKKDDILEANALILDERIERSIQGEVINSRIEGRVSIEEGAKILNSIVRGPTIIGENSVIEDSFIGPYTSIGKNVRIKNSSIEYSVILDNVEITGIERLEESLIGKNAIIRKNEERKIIKLHVGDYSEVNL
ncbi:MAG: glucose-1-phosphate thymidylyltransferase [Thermoproteota archaeon]